MSETILNVIIWCAYIIGAFIFAVNIMRVRNYFRDKSMSNNGNPKTDPKVKSFINGWSKIISAMDQCKLKSHFKNTITDITDEFEYLVEDLKINHKNPEYNISVLTNNYNFFVKDIKNQRDRIEFQEILVSVTGENTPKFLEINRLLTKGQIEQLLSDLYGTTWYKFERGRSC